MADFKQVVSNPKFYGLSADARKIVLQKISPEFGGLSPEAQDNVIQKLEMKFNSGAPAAPEPAGPGPAAPEVPMMAAHAPVNNTDPYQGMGVVEKATRQAAHAIAPYTDVLVPGLAAAGGAVAGGVGGAVATAPSGGLGAVLGAPAGAGVGNAAGSRIADEIRRYGEGNRAAPRGSIGEEAMKDVNRFAEGATFEGVAPVIAGKVAGAVKKTARVIWNPIETGVGKMLSAVLGDGTTIFAQNREEAKAIEKALGTRYTLAEQSNSPALIKKQRTLERASNEFGDELAIRRSQNAERARGAYGEAFGQDVNGIDKASAAIQKRADSLQGNLDTAQNVVQEEVNRVGSVSAPEEIGQQMLGAAKKGEAAVKENVKAAYGAVGNEELPIGALRTEVSNAIKPLHKYEPAENIPDILKTVQKDLTESSIEKLSISDLQGLRSALLNEASKSNGANPALESRLYKVVGAIEQTIGSGESGSVALREANKLYRTNYAEVFRQGEMGQILKKGANREISKVPLERIPAKIFNRQNLTAAKQFDKAVGQETAKNIAADYAAYDLAKTMDTGVNQAKLKNWYSKNKRVLEHYGISENFNSVQAAQSTVEAAQGAMKEFERSAANRLLKADSGVAISNAMQGPNKVKNVRELLNAIGTDKAGRAGLQQAFSDFILDKTAMVAKELNNTAKISNAAFDKLYRTYDDAMKVLYQDSPKKLQAIKDLRRGVEIVHRSLSSPSGGGSDTFELFGGLATRFQKLNFMNFKFNVVKSVYGAINRAAMKISNSVWERALLDPEYADKIVKLYKGKVPVNDLSSYINQLNKSAAAVGTESAIRSAARNATNDQEN
jgi:hypothetical protein